MLRNFNILTEPPEPVVDLYFKQCSVSVNCRDLGIMAATLANRGVNPITGKQAIRGEYVESIISVMASCGMYDYAGEWLYRIGMPAKSGVAGGVIAVLPGHLGIGVFSPLLDPRGNSVRGIQVCDSLSRALDLHLFNLSTAASSVIRLHFNGDEVNSSRLRYAEEMNLLRKSGKAIQLYQLQGSLVFSSCEALLRRVLDGFEPLQYLILDLKHVLAIDESACRLLFQLRTRFAAQNRFLVFSRTGHLPALRRYMKAKLGAQFENAFQAFADNDMALEWCESKWLEAQSPGSARVGSAPLESYDLFRDLTPQELEVVADRLEHRAYRQGEVIVEIGAKAREVFLIRRGSATITIPLANGAQRRLGVFSAGMAFGEVAMLDGAPRSAVVRADTDMECHLLKHEDFEALEEHHPHIKVTLLRNMALGLARLLRKVTREVGVFDF